MTRQRWVLDTNVLVSALLWQGKPGRLIEAAGEQRIRLCTSRAMLDELEATLNKKKLARAVAATGSTAADMLARYGRIATVVRARRLREPVSRDADDDAVLACALAARAGAVVTGDDDLLVLERFEGIAIIGVQQALALLESS